MPAPSRLSPPEFLRLVGDPQRWQLLSALAVSDRRVGELTGLVDRPQNLVSYHLGELRSAGIVTARKSSADRRDTYYRVDLARCGELLADVGASLHPGLRLEPPAPPGRDAWGGRVPTVLFLCTGNSARSQMAEALLEHHTGHRARARSAGSHPKALHPNAVKVMAARGIDISGCSSKHLSRFARSRFDRVITLCDRVREICPEFPGRPRSAHWSMADPAASADADGDNYPAFETAADEIEARIRLLITQMAAEQGKRRNQSAS